MSARPETVALLESWLAEDRNVEDTLAGLRDLVCDLVWAGDALHRETEAVAKHAPKGFALGVTEARESWESIGGQSAIDEMDALIGSILDTLGVSR